MPETPGFDPNRADAEQHAKLEDLHASTTSGDVETDRLKALRALAAEHPVAGPDTVRQAVAGQQAEVTPINAPETSDQAEGYAKAS